MELLSHGTGDRRGDQGSMGAEPPMEVRSTWEAVRISSSFGLGEKSHNVLTFYLMEI